MQPRLSLYLILVLVLASLATAATIEVTCPDQVVPQTPVTCEMHLQLNEGEQHRAIQFQINLPEGFQAQQDFVTNPSSKLTWIFVDQPAVMFDFPGFLQSQKIGDFQLLAGDNPGEITLVDGSAIPDLTLNSNVMEINENPNANLPPLRDQPGEVGNDGNKLTLRDVNVCTQAAKEGAGLSIRNQDKDNTCEYVYKGVIIHKRPGQEHFLYSSNHTHQVGSKWQWSSRCPIYYNSLGENPAGWKRVSGSKAPTTIEEAKRCIDHPKELDEFPLSNPACPFTILDDSDGIVPLGEMCNPVNNDCVGDSTCNDNGRCELPQHCEETPQGGVQFAKVPGQEAFESKEPECDGSHLITYSCTVTGGLDTDRTNCHVTYQICAETPAETYACVDQDNFAPECNQNCNEPTSICVAGQSTQCVWDAELQCFTNSQPQECEAGCNTQTGLCNVPEFQGEDNCEDGLDNDENGFADCQDSYCRSQPVCLPKANGEACTQNIDCLSGTCTEGLCAGDVNQNDNQDNPPGVNPEICEQPGDEDNDGSHDCADADCNGHVACQQEICNNDQDDNNDNAIDCADAACVNHASCQPLQPDISLTDQILAALQGDNTIQELATLLRSTRGDWR